VCFPQTFAGGAPATKVPVIDGNASGGVSIHLYEGAVGNPMPINIDGLPGSAVISLDAVATGLNLATSDGDISLTCNISSADHANINLTAIASGGSSSTVVISADSGGDVSFSTSHGDISLIAFSSGGGLSDIVINPSVFGTPQALTFTAHSTGGVEINSNHLVLSCNSSGTDLILDDKYGGRIDFNGPAIQLTCTNLIVATMPTSAAGLPTGCLWNNIGVVNIA
jgi:hypothetical protein